MSFLFLKFYVMYNLLPCVTPPHLSKLLSILGTEFFRDVKSYSSHYLFIISLILAEFYNAGQIFLFSNLDNIIQSKKEKFCFLTKISEVITQIYKKENL